MLIRAATRGSALALWQTRHVAELLAPHGVTVEEVVVSTTGDARLDIPIHAMGGKGVFVKEVQAAVLAGHADIAVHSMKDLPSITPDGLTLAAVPVRADARDALVGSRLSGLAQGANVATGSVRRRAQLAALRADLVVSELRGNITTRLEKAGQFDAIIMAAAALERLGETPEVVDVLAPEVMLPQVGQGALAIEARRDHTEVIELLAHIEDPSSRRLTDAERAFLAELGGDCDLPAGAYATPHPDGIRLHRRNGTGHRRVGGFQIAVGGGSKLTDTAAGQDHGGVRNGVRNAAHVCSPQRRAGTAWTGGAGTCSRGAE
ncbi:MAG: hydroxymethylbilane synthase [Acidimicrobiales bacterium]